MAGQSASVRTVVTDAERSKDFAEARPQVSIVSVCLNSASTIVDTVRSVSGQGYPSIEHIIIDGGSTDGTLQVLSPFRERIAVLVSEPDGGMYDAMNKGIRLASGSIIGILNADDVYAGPDVIATVVKEFVDKDIDALFADLVIVDRENTDRTIRYYRSASFQPGRFAYGWMPAHPTFFTRKTCYERYGLYKTDYRVAADYELLVRFLARKNIPYSYLDRVIVKMRQGGVSNRGIENKWITNQEIVRACRENGVETNLFKILLKYPRKLFEFLERPAGSSERR